MAKDNLIGINELKLIIMIQNMMNYINTISSVFEEMEELMDDSSTFASDEIGEAFREKFSEFQEEFPKIKSNLETYVTDLKNIKNNYLSYTTQGI